MVNQCLLDELNLLIGNLDSPYFKYLLFSHKLTQSEGEEVVQKIKSKIENDELIDDLIDTLEDSCQKKVLNIEKSEKINYLNDLINTENNFYIKYLKDFQLNEKESLEVHEKIKNEIESKNINYYEIQRNLKDYYKNKVFQRTYFNRLLSVTGYNCDSIHIKKILRKYNNIDKDDLIKLVEEIKKEIYDGKEFGEFKNLFNNRVENISEKKKAAAKKQFDSFIFDFGDIFKNILKDNNLTWDDGQVIINEVNTLINEGKIIEEEIDGMFVVNYVKEWKK